MIEWRKIVTLICDADLPKHMICAGPALTVSASKKYSNICIVRESCCCVRPERIRAPHVHGCFINGRQHRGEVNEKAEKTKQKVRISLTPVGPQQSGPKPTDGGGGEMDVCCLSVMFYLY